MLIAQISDTHMLPPGETAYGVTDTEKALVAAIKTINAANPDFVIHTGDLAHHGAPAAYQLAIDILQDLNAPYCAIPGNHDDRSNMRNAFRETDWMPSFEDPTAFIHYEVDLGELRLIAVDSTIPGETGGELCEERLDWLTATLSAAPDTPTIIALHHPPFPSGLPGFSSYGLTHADKFATLLADQPQVKRIIAGHNHRNIIGMCGPVPTVVGPSASYPFAFDTEAGAPLSISHEAPGVAMHLWRQDLGLLSHCVAIGDFPTPTPVIQAGKVLK
jgi:3',5'-cyclic AMP phosphodiesterase CpdA